MSCCTYNLQISQGDTFNLALNLTNSSGLPLDLTNCLISGWIQSKLSCSGILCNLNPQIQLPSSSGIISLNIPYSGTQLLPCDIFPYQIQMYNTGVVPQIVTKILNGYAYIYYL